MLAACGTPAPQEEHAPESAGGRTVFNDAHVPDFARRPYEPFTRADAVGIALREWRAFGQLIDDDPPDTRPPPAPEDKPERQPGLWERVGEYWWLGQDAERPEAAWTGKHDDAGGAFDARKDYAFAWSAAFISYVMRSAGAGARFPYSPSHATYINIARQMSLNETTGWAITAAAPDAYAPQPGDLICFSRTRRPLRFADLPTAHGFPAHCDVVVAVATQELSVVGGNVDDAVTLKHVPVTADGRLAMPGGAVVDTRYPWLVVLRVQYDR